MPTITEQLSATLKQATMYIEKLMDSEDIKDVVKAVELIKAFSSDKAAGKKLEAKQVDMLQRKAADYELGETFKVGMKHYQVQQGMGQSALDRAKLALEFDKVDADADARASMLGAIYAKTVSQKEIDKILSDNGIVVKDISTLYTQEPNGKTIIKEVKPKD